MPDGDSGTMTRMCESCRIPRQAGTRASRGAVCAAMRCR